MAKRHFLRSLPGWLATLLAVLATAQLTVSSASSMYYEGWGQPVPVLLRYLLPGIACFILCLLALRWPRAGGLLLLAAGLLAAAWWLNMQAGMWGLTPIVFQTALLFFGPAIVTACLFLFEGRHQRLLREEGVPPSPRWFARNYRYVLVVAAAFLGFGIISAEKLPQRLARLDDGQRGMRVIQGNGVTLVWAPKGPGWNQEVSAREYPSWNMIALYGAAPLGLQGKERRDGPPATGEDMKRTSLCAYLNEDATALLAEPKNIWRMPTADEIVRSLTRDGVNAGCEWDGKSWHATCRKPTDKETPLWAPDQPPIYYWSADERGPGDACGINYEAGISELPKSWRSIGFRCVKETVRLQGP
jgi:hypothetical protein